jgi:hypothetical protein
MRRMDLRLYVRDWIYFGCESHRLLEHLLLSQAGDFRRGVGKQDGSVCDGSE